MKQLLKPLGTWLGVYLMHDDAVPNTCTQICAPFTISQAPTFLRFDLFMFFFLNPLPFS